MDASPTTGAGAIRVPSTAYLIKSAEAVNRQHIDRILRSSPLTVTQWVALGVLEHRPLSSAQLARRSFVTPQSVQDVVKALETKGFVERRRSDVSRRERLISITESGVAALRAVEPDMATLDAAITADFSDAEVEMFRALLVRARASASTFAPGRRSEVPIGADGVGEPA
ncbi:MarR family winged helix-turn-helix transcriptional regulator [Georgenia sp. AZ-5]|uniref:MarR family winged helix-turn-helix transcriptional regulator n=1 Tax=Georgenia sp. AZ-5 TaxID=3367526 RepID=UPI003754132B